MWLWNWFDLAHLRFLPFFLDGSIFPAHQINGSDALLLANTPPQPTPHALHPPLCALSFSEYGPVFRLSTVISGYTAYSPWLTGDNILNCFGFDNGRFSTDLELLVAIGAAGLLLAYALLKRA